MLPVKIAFTREKEPDLFSKVIMRGMDTNYSHCLIIHKDKIFHSVEEGSISESLDEFLKTHVIVEQVEVLFTESEKVFEAYMKGQFKKEYSISQFLGIGADMVDSFLSGLGIITTRRFTNWVRKATANGEEKMICSEKVSLFLQDYCGYILPKPADFMTPKDVLNLLLKELNDV